MFKLAIVTAILLAAVWRWTAAYTMELTNISHGSSLCMTEYLISARAVIILWTKFAVVPAEMSLTRLKPNWSAAASNHKGLRLRPFVARPVRNGIAI
jgi:hypothetical protein